MVFSSPVFLFLFLPLCLVCVLLAAGAERLAHVRRREERSRPSRRAQNAVLLLFSLGFYLYGSGSHFLLLCASTLLAHAAGLCIAYTRFRRGALGLGVAVQIALLGYYKYANFFVDQGNAVATWLGAEPLPWAPVLLPVGISFFVFQAVSYLIDVQRRDCAPLKNPLDVALYIAMFPQLIAGPIVRFSDIASELHEREVSAEDAEAGAARFVYGLCKKVVVADAVGAIADACFAVPANGMTSAVALTGAFAYTFQIYFDFSAYSDMAIGLGRIFGFHFPENFRRPLTAWSITDFWRRWHMTLSFWFRDYVYLPLGGSRGSRLRTYANLWAVFLLSGLWHGANWTFVLWGAFHGLLLTLERVFGLRTASDERAGAVRIVVRRGATFLLVIVGFTMFRAQDVSQGLLFYRHMLVPTDFSLPLAVLEQLSNKNIGFFGVAFASLLLPSRLVIGQWLAGVPTERTRALRLVVLTGGALYAGALIASNNFSPFIYFQF